MPKLLFLSCSHLVSIDKITNNLSVYHIIEQINIPNFPFVFPQLFITSLWQRSNEEENLEFEVKINFLNPDRISIKDWRADWKFTSLHHRHILNAINLTFDYPGTYAFKIFIRKKGQKEWNEQAWEIQLHALKSPPAKKIKQ